jgi:SET domain-containing protein
MPRLIVENNQIVLNKLRDSKTGETICIDLPTDPKEREEKLAYLQEVSDLFYEAGKKRREMLSKPCDCWMCQ